MLECWDIDCLKYFKHLKILIVLVHTLFCNHYHDWLNQKIDRYTDLKTQKRVYKQILVGVNVRLGNRLNEFSSQIQSVWLSFCCVSIELHLHAVWELKVKWEMQNISFYEEGCRHSSTLPVYVAKSSLYAERFPDILMQDFWVCTLSCNFCYLARWLMPSSAP